jgi:carbon monoxide dehydrogenase subunit G
MRPALNTLCVNALAAMALGWATPGHAADLPAPAVPEQAVRVERNDSGFSIDLVMHASASPAVAWAVLTDFDHMAEFIPNLSSSQVVQRGENALQIRQTGHSHWGPLTMHFESLREVTLLPQREIRTHGLSGTVKRVDSSMTLEAEGSGTLLHYHTEVDPGAWFPPLLGPAKVRQETAAQFSAILQEMERRQEASKR